MKIILESFSFLFFLTNITKYTRKMTNIQTNILNKGHPYWMLLLFLWGGKAAKLDYIDLVNSFLANLPDIFPRNPCVIHPNNGWVCYVISGVCVILVTNIRISTNNIIIMAMIFFSVLLLHLAFVFVSICNN